MKNTATSVCPEDYELRRLRAERLLDDKNRPIRMTHITTRELHDGEGHTIAIYENVFMSPLETSGDGLIIFDREGKAFEVSHKDVRPMERSHEVLAV